MVEKSDTVAIVLFCFALIAISFGYGAISHRYKLFPVPQIKEAQSAATRVLEALGAKLPWHNISSEQKQITVVHLPEAIAPGLTLVSGIGAEGDLFARIVV